MQPPNKEALLGDVLNFLSEQSMGTISTVASDNTPESALVNYFIDNDWTIYIVTDKDSRKIQNIKQNPHVAFVVGGPSIPHTVQIQADAEIIENTNPDFDTFFQKIKDSKKLERDPMYDMFSDKYDILQIKITWLRWLYFEEGTGKAIYAVLIP